MGNDQSKGSGEQENQPLDYYELLQISEEATGDEIKRAYRKLAVGVVKTMLTLARQSSRQESPSNRRCHKIIYRTTAGLRGA